MFFLTNLFVPFNYNCVSLLKYLSMIYKLNENNEYVPANIFDIENYYYITELVFNNSVPAKYYHFTNRDILLFSNNIDDSCCITLNKKVMLAETVAILKTIDTTKYFKTNYRIFNSEDTNTIFYKLYFVATAFKYAELVNITLSEALEKCSKVDIYGSYMQAECVQDVAEYIKKYL